MTSVPPSRAADILESYQQITMLNETKVDPQEIVFPEPSGMIFTEIKLTETARNNLSSHISSNKGESHQSRNTLNILELMPPWSAVNDEPRL